MNNDQYSSKGFLPRYISWLTIVLALLAIGTFLAISSPGVRYATPMGIGGGAETGAVPPTYAGISAKDTSVSYAPSQGMMGPDAYYYPYPYPYPSPDVPVTDTREFLKVYYNASMRTRDVPNLTRRVETTVRGYDGRIDQESSSPQYGYVSFAVPQSKYNAFRTELESLVNSRFLTVNISSQNLLPQKISIEEQQKQATTALSDYKTARQKIVSAHASAVQSLQGKIDADAEQLAILRAQPSTPQILAQIQTVSDDWTALKQRLADENASYTAKLSSADANIKYAQDWQKAVQTQDKTLLENVATVNGTVSIQWISFWDVVRLYLPGYWIPFIFAVLAFLSYLRDRRRSIAPVS
ncbi:MAG: DUF4349 domain-containing protein [bacterium]|nr:DUF4349 domain-containing protein [bacterium]